MGSDIIAQVSPRTLGPISTLAMTYHAAVTCIAEKIDGAFVEAGVFAGGHPAVMGRVSQVLEPKADREVWLYDSFCGVPQAGPEDKLQPGIGKKEDGASGELVTSGVSGCSVQDVMSHMVEWGLVANFVYIEGWFQATMKVDRPETIAILRLDGDLYESTKVALETLFPLLAKGGFLIVDDYHLAGCKKAVDDYLSAAMQSSLQKIPDGNGGVWLRRPEGRVFRESGSTKIETEQST